MRFIKTPVPFSWPTSAGARQALRWAMYVLGMAWLFVAPGGALPRFDPYYLRVVVLFVTTVGGYLVFWWLGDKFGPLASPERSS